MRNGGTPSTNGEPSVSGGVNDMSTSDIRTGRDERDKGKRSRSLPLSFLSPFRLKNSSTVADDRS